MDEDREPSRLLVGYLTGAVLGSQLPLGLPILAGAPPGGLGLRDRADNSRRARFLNGAYFGTFTRGSRSSCATGHSGFSWPSLGGLSARPLGSSA